MHRDIFTHKCVATCMSGNTPRSGFYWNVDLRSWQTLSNRSRKAFERFASLHLSMSCYCVCFLLFLQTVGEWTPAGYELVRVAAPSAGRSVAMPHPVCSHNRQAFLNQTIWDKHLTSISRSICCFSQCLVTLLSKAVVLNLFRCNASLSASLCAPPK